MLSASVLSGRGCFGAKGVRRIGDGEYDENVRGRERAGLDDFLPLEFSAAILGLLPIRALRNALVVFELAVLYESGGYF
jgi:hypothetical protein